MKKKILISITLIFFIGISLSLKQEIHNNLPNIIIIFADDMGYGDVSALNPKAKTYTPAIDKMIKTGMLFTEAHASASVCTPSRYGLLTGRYAFRNRLEGGNVAGYDRSVLEPGRKTIGHLLKNAGYTTACIGKWHLGFDWITQNSNEPPKMDKVSKFSNVDFSKPIKYGPNDYGFDYSFIHPASLDIPPYLFLQNGLATDPKMILSTDIYPKNLSSTKPAWDKKHTDQSDIYWNKGVWWRNGEMSSSFRIENCLEKIVEEGLHFIKKQTSNVRNKPFFLYLPLTGPHTPWMPNQNFAGKSSVGTYGDFILAIDNVVKEINEQLQKQGIADNTMLIFTTDNGGYWPEEEIKLQKHNSNYGRRGQKGDVWDGGHHVPMVIKWPNKIPKARKYNHLVSLTDLFATFADFTGQKMDNESGEDSFSFSFVFNGNLTKPTRSSMIHNSSQKFYAIREGDWKYIDRLGSGGFTQPTTVEIKPGMPKGQLYNLKKDPLEANNLYSKYPDIMNDLQQKITKAIESGRTR